MARRGWGGEALRVRRGARARRASKVQVLVALLAQADVREDVAEGALGLRARPSDRVPVTVHLRLALALPARGALRLRVQLKAEAQAVRGAILGRGQLYDARLARLLLPTVPAMDHGVWVVARLRRGDAST